MTNVTIDGKTIEVPEGTTVLRAAEMAGIKIPTLCDHPELTPYGGCRLCLVEVEGARTLQPSCTLPVNNNMVVRTATDKVLNARKFVLTLIFSERNHFCPYCQVSGGDCKLQNAAYNEGMTHWPLQPNWTPFAVDASHPYFILDNNRCILCRACVRACGELVGNYTLGFEERGAKSILVADLGTPLGQSTCISCGTCLQVCPTGSLIDRQSAYRGKDVQVDHNLTVCAGCSVGCGMDILTRDNRMVRIEGNWDAEINDGLLCKVGRFMPLEENRERIVTPLVRKDGVLKAATWDEAMNVLAARLSPLTGKNGSGVAALASTRLTSEALSTFKQLFADRMGSTMVTSLEEGQYTAVSSALANEIGQSFEGRLEMLVDADCTLVLNADLVREHEVASFFIKRAIPNGAKLVVVDSDPNALEANATVTLKTGKAPYADVLGGLASAIVKLGLGKVEAVTGNLDEIAARTGIDAVTYMQAAFNLASAEKPVFLYGKDISAAALKSLLELAHLTGAAVLSLKGEANSMSAALLGLEKPFALNGQQAVYVALGDDTPSQRLIKRLEGAPFLAVQASFASQLTASADVVLPVERWVEQEGHYINLDGHIQAGIRAVTPVEEVRSNAVVLQDLYTRLGFAPANDWKEQISQRVPSAALVQAN